MELKEWTRKKTTKGVLREKKYTKGQPNKARGTRAPRGETFVGGEKRALRNFNSELCNPGTPAKGHHLSRVEKRGREKTKSVDP